MKKLWFKISLLWHKLFGLPDARILAWVTDWLEKNPEDTIDTVTVSERLYDDLLKMYPDWIPFYFVRNNRIVLVSKYGTEEKYRRISATVVASKTEKSITIRPTMKVVK